MYKIKYKEMIENAKAECRTKRNRVYYESHHIIPDFMFKERARKGPRGHLEGNPNAKSNKVLLTFREHLLAHYYLYEILKGSHYGYSAGSSLQFFFSKGLSTHPRQRNMSEVDEAFLVEMECLKAIGIESLSKARTGKMPVVDSVTREVIGSIPVDHPKVLSGEWCHHSKGRPGTKQPAGFGVGSTNRNYKEMTPERKLRVMDCVSRSIVENRFIMTAFSVALKTEFVEFKKISYVWIQNNFGSINGLILEYNILRKQDIKYIPYYRSDVQKLAASHMTSSKKWVTNGILSKSILISELDDFLIKNTNYRKGRK
jgi:hypothetical protein